MKPPRRPAGNRPSAAAGAVGGRPLREIRDRLAEGVAHHRAGRLGAAAKAYRRVLAMDSRQPDALHLAGLVAHAEGDQATAQALVERAIAVRPAPAFHNSLGVIRLEAGDAAAARRHFARALADDPLYAEAYLNDGNALQRLGRLAEAVAAYDRALAIDPAHAEALAGQGRALHLLGRPTDAAARFRGALARHPDWPKVLRWLADSLAESGQRGEAQALLNKALALDPSDGDTLAALAALAERSNQLDAALAYADQALAAQPRLVRAALAAARVLRRQGRIVDGLARLEPLQPSPSPEASPMASPEAAEAAALVQFERAMLLDRAGDSDAAFAAFADGNRRMQAAAPPSDADRDFFPALIRRLGDRFTPAWVAGWTPPAAAEPALPADPVFLIGFPRSGTTLLDQILDAHPALVTLEEKDAIDVLRRRVAAMPGGYPEALAALTAAEQQDLRRRYWAEVAGHLGRLPDPAAGQRLVDKMPLNSIDAGLIARLFPQGRFILALRHPADVVLSNFMQAFKPNAAMLHSATLDDAARFYAQVMGLWEHYRAVLPLACHVVRYEDLIADLEAEARGIVRFLGLPWDPGMLAYRTRAADRAIATPSYHQVVEPLYRRAVGRWQRYRPFFAAAAADLAPFVAAYGYGWDDADPPATPVP